MDDGLLKNFLLNSSDGNQNSDICLQDFSGIVMSVSGMELDTSGISCR